MFPISLPPLASLLKNKTEKGAAAAPDKQRHLPGVHSPAPIWPKLWGGKASAPPRKPGCSQERGPHQAPTAGVCFYTGQLQSGAGSCTLGGAGFGAGFTCQEHE